MTILGDEIPRPPERVFDTSLAQLRGLRPEDFPHDMHPGEFRHILEVCDALWLHSGDPKAPHAELTSGRCSNGFVDVLRMLRFANLCGAMAIQLVRRLADYWHDTSPHRYAEQDKQRRRVDWVVGSDHAGATLSYAVAARLSAQHDFTEKGPDRTQVWRRFTIEPGEAVLQVEDLVTTSGTLKAVREGIRAGNPYLVTWAPVVLTLVHRSDTYEFEGAPILYLVHYDIKSWEPSECPLCAQGSRRLRPKQNWAELVRGAAT